jgi:hypothetical protein
MMMSLSPLGTGTPLAQPMGLPLATTAKQPRLQPTAEEVELADKASNSGGLSSDDLALLTQLLASSDESKPNTSGVSPEKMPTPSGAMLQAQNPNIVSNPICKQDGLCGACTPQDELDV